MVFAIIVKLLLGVSEAELLTTKVGKDCIRLKGNGAEILKAFSTLGEVMSLTRNDSCVLKHIGTFNHAHTFGPDSCQKGIVIGSIETRALFGHWHVAFAVVQYQRGNVSRSIQVFDEAGQAVTKAFLLKGSGFGIASARMDESRILDHLGLQS